MVNKNVAALILLLCAVFQCAVSTGILLDMLKNTVQKTRCNLHNVGSKIVEHGHHHNNPCAQPEPENDGNDEYGSQGTHDFHGNHYGSHDFHGHNHANPNFGSQNGYHVYENFNEDRPTGNSYNYGVTLKCYWNTDCPADLFCVRSKCADPCPGTCGLNAECQVISHIPRCYCPPGYFGDAFIKCYQNVQESNNAQQGIDVNEYTHEPFNRPNGNLGFETSTYTYQTTEINGISKVTSNQENGGHSYVENTTKDTKTNPNNNNLPVDNFLPHISSTTTAKEPAVTQSIDNVIEDIFGKPNIEVTSEIYPSTLDIDVRAGQSEESAKKITKKKIPKKTYADVPSDGGRNIIKVGCPDGKTSTTTGECLEEF